jgi:hypothetical protein
MRESKYSTKLCRTCTSFDEKSCKRQISCSVIVAPMEEENKGEQRTGTYIGLLYRDVTDFIDQPKSHRRLRHSSIHLESLAFSASHAAFSTIHLQYRICRYAQFGSRRSEPQENMQMIVYGHQRPVTSNRSAAPGRFGSQSGVLLNCPFTTERFWFSPSHQFFAVELSVFRFSMMQRATALIPGAATKAVECHRKMQRSM